MKVLGVILVLVGLGVGFGLGRLSAPDRAVSDPTSVAAFADAIEELDPLERKYKLTQFLQGLTPDNLPEVLERVHARLHFVGKEDLELLMLAWARFDPEAALTNSLAWPRHSRERASIAAMSAWAHYDPENAVVGLHLVDELRLRGLIKDALVHAWINSPHKEGVSEFLARMKPGIKRQKYITRLSEEYLRQGHGEMKRWVESISDDEEHKDYKTMAFEKASNTLASVDPIEASKWIEGLLEKGHSTRAPLYVARRWLADDVLSAFEWIVSLPEFDGRERAVDQIFSDFLRKKPKMAENWIREAAPAEGLDPAVRVLVKNNVKTQPLIAISWAEFMNDPELQDETRVRVGRYWLRHEAEVAKAWLKESGFPEKTLEKIFDKRADVAESPAPGKRGIAPGVKKAGGAPGMMGRGPGARVRAGK